MAGRPLPNEAEMSALGYNNPDMSRRREVLRETLLKLETSEISYHRLAADNLARWQASAAHKAPIGEVLVVPGDWGEVTLALTKEYGTCFAVLNMANAHVPGGGYVEGMVAQEENMYRRTDCHFSIGAEAYDETRDRYRPHMTHLLEARDNRVYLDRQQPRVCLRGPEDRNRGDLGYAWLPDDSVFPFFELRASAQDLRGGVPFSRDEGRKRIAAQLDTLREGDVRYAVLGAFGCGAFENPSKEVARIYREEIEKRRGDFALIAFAIFAAGYGPSNYPIFVAEFTDS